MTWPEFLKALRDTKRAGYKWTNSMEELRARCEGRRFCPITAVCYFKTKNWHDLNDTEEAARELRLRGDRVIVNAADILTDKNGPTERRKRRQMLQAVGLREAEE